MTKPKYSAEQRAEAVSLYVDLGSREAWRTMQAKGVDVAESTIRAWAKAGPDPVETKVVERRTTNVESAKLMWQERRMELANKAGEAADEFLDHMRTAAKNGDADMVKALVPAFGVSVDKAQLLTGAPTGRDEHRQVSAAQMREVVEAKVVELRGRSA